jgi:hypothetical protein
VTTDTITKIVEAARAAGWPAANPTLVAAVLAGTAIIATTGAGVSPELAAFIRREARMLR